MLSMCKAQSQVLGQRQLWAECPLQTPKSYTFWKP